MVTEAAAMAEQEEGLRPTLQCGLRRKDVPISEKDRLAAEVEDRWVDFQDGLSNKRRYPVEQFRAFWEAGKRYAELTKNDPLIHRKVVVAINGLREFLEVERKRIPGTIIADADRLESLLFNGFGSPAALGLCTTLRTG
jgi:hypothetical protein